MRVAARVTAGAALAGALLLAGCGTDAEAGPASVNSDEARALGEAAEMLDEQRLPADAGTEQPGAAPAAT